MTSKPIQYTIRWFLLTCSACLMHLSGNSQLNYAYRFNPKEGIVKAAEKPFRQEICLNGRWEICPVYSTDTTLTGIPPNIKWDSQKIKIPSAWNVNGFPGDNRIDFVAYPSYPKKWQDAMQAWMKRDFTVPATWKQGRQVILHFEAVAGKAIYYLNGEKVGENFDIFFPYELDVTDKIKPGQKNELLVHVMAPKLFDHQQKYGRRPYVSGSFWGTYIRGIWEDVYLLSEPDIHLSQTFIQPKVTEKQLVVEVQVTNQSNKPQKIALSGEVHRWRNSGTSASDKQVKMQMAPEESSAFDGATELTLQAGRPLLIKPGESKKMTLSATVKNGQLALWSPNSPALQVLLLNVTANGHRVDRKYQRFGWRQYQIHQDTLLLNGEPLHLRGDSWHFMGVPQMTRRYAWAWYTMLKKANANAVRLHAEPFPSFYLDMADEMGICVLDESAIWASDGGPNFGSATYWANCLIHLNHLVKRDRNHASVFGWSVCNETIPVARNVFHAPDSLVNYLVSQINGWVQEVKRLDPTRPWISGDGETDVPTNLPTVVGHYGGNESMQKWAHEGKPWGIGEQSMAYYGTPKQVATINGSRAYVSQEGRMEGLATEAFRLLRAQQQLNATYSSVFNIVWYGLKPLNLGMRDTSRPTSLADGIFYTHYKDGEPGMQPERLGPYTTTLNPGYDPKLPLYEPWPFFNAIRDANGLALHSDGASAKSLNDKWEQEAAAAKKAAALKTEARKETPRTTKHVYYLSDSHQPLFKTIQNLGVKIEKATKLSLLGDLGKGALIIIDGLHPPVGKDSIDWIQKATRSGADLCILGIQSGSLQSVNQLLPAPVELTNREASALIIKHADPILKGLDNGDLYFSEILKTPIMQNGLTGPFVRSGKVLVEACGTDWTMWNGRSEYSKTANVLKSERETKPAGNILVKAKSGLGNIYLFGCPVASTSGAMDNLVEQMLRNLGAGFGAKGMAGNLPLSMDGRVQAALYLGRYSTSRNKVEDLIDKHFISDDARNNPKLGQKVNDHVWRAAFVADTHNEFDFKQLAANGPEDNAVNYLSFWVYSPRSLSNLLAEPDMPALVLVVETKDAMTVMLNGKKVARQLNATEPELKIPNLQLDKGWNHILIKSIHFNGPWRSRIQFTCDQPEFLKQLHTALEQQ